MTAKVLEFGAKSSEFRGTHETNYGFGTATTQTARVVVTAPELYVEHAHAELLGPEALYQNSSGENDLVFQALKLLREATDYLATAATIDPAMDYTFFDTQIMKARVVLETAFRLRAIGDGYAGLINALTLALKNAEVEPLNRRQLSLMVSAIGRLRHGPFMHFDTAMLIMDELEDADLDIEPSAMDEFLPVDVDTE